MSAERDIFEQDDKAAIAASDARAEADIAAGRVVPHDKVVAWLKTWGTSDEAPPPSEWFK